MHHTAMMIISVMCYDDAILTKYLCQCDQAQHFAALKIQDHFRSRGKAQNKAIRLLEVSWLLRHTCFQMGQFFSCVFWGGGGGGVHFISLLCFMIVPSPPLPRH